MSLSPFKRHYIFLCILSLVFNSCRKKTNQPGQFSFEDFKKQQSLTGSPRHLENLHFGTDLTVIPEKDLLLIIDLRNDSSYVNAYNLKTLKFIKAFVKKGVGPNEQLDCNKLQYDKAAKYLYAVDRSKSKIFQYAIDDIIDPKKAVFPKWDLTLDNKGLSKPLLLSNGNFVDYSIPKPNQPPSVFSFYRADGTPLFKRGHFPSIEENYSPSEIRTAFEGQFFSSKDGKHIVLSYFNGDYIDVYDSIGNLQHRVHGPELFEPAVSTTSKYGGKMIINNEGSHFAYASPKINGDSVLVLYQGKGAPEGAYHENKLLLFNQKLRPEVLYNLTQPIFLFDVDWRTKTLYALTHQVKDSNLIIVKLP